MADYLQLQVRAQTKDHCQIITTAHTDPVSDASGSSRSPVNTADSSSKYVANGEVAMTVRCNTFQWMDMNLGVSNEGKDWNLLKHTQPFIFKVMYNAE